MVTNLYIICINTDSLETARIREYSAAKLCDQIQGIGSIPCSSTGLSTLHSLNPDLLYVFYFRSTSIENQAGASETLGHA